MITTEQLAALLATLDPHNTDVTIVDVGGPPVLRVTENGETTSVGQLADPALALEMIRAWISGRVS